MEKPVMPNPETMTEAEFDKWLEPEGEHPLFFCLYEKMYNYICRFIPAELQE